VSANEYQAEVGRVGDIGEVDTPRVILTSDRKLGIENFSCYV
jgi:hypothetical protein